MCAEQQKKVRWDPLLKRTKSTQSRQSSEWKQPVRCERFTLTHSINGASDRVLTHSFPQWSPFPIRHTFFLTCGCHTSERMRSYGCLVRDPAEVGSVVGSVVNPTSTQSRHLSGNRTASAEDLQSVNQWGLGSSPDPFNFSVRGISSPSYVFSDLCLTHLSAQKPCARARHAC